MKLALYCYTSRNTSNLCKSEAIFLTCLFPEGRHVLW